MANVRNRKGDRAFLGRLISAGLVIILGMTADAAAQNLVGRPTRGIFGLKLGVVSRMNMTGGRQLHSEIGSCAQVYADLPQGKRFYLSAAFDFYYVEIARSNQIMIEGSFGVKRAYNLEHARMILKPGVSIGFAYLAEMGGLPASQYLTGKLLLETYFKIDAKKAWVGELALFHASHGTDGDLDIGFGPGLILRWGLAFQ